MSGGLNRALQKPEESVRRPAQLDDSKLNGLTDNTARRQVAEQDAVTIADTLYALVSQIKQILYGVDSPAGRWTDVPPASLLDVASDIQSVSDSINTSVWTAGEEIIRGQLVYVSQTTNSVRIARQNDTEHTTVIGVAEQSALPGQSVRIAHSGKVITGLTGITPGLRYFLQANGTFGTEPPAKVSGTLMLQVGFGKTATSLLVLLGEPKIRP